MATLNTELPTLLDHMQARDPNGAPAMVVETLTRKNNLLTDAVWQEANGETYERVTSRTGLPSISWRKFNEGVSPSKSKTNQFDESIGMMEGWSVCDAELANLGGNAAAKRASEDKAFMAAFNNEAESGTFYHSTKTTPEKFMGLAPRMDATAGQAGSHIIKHDASASGSDQASAWLVVWGPESVYCIFPKGSNGGLTPHDMGEQTWDDGTGKKFRAYVTNWNWKMGLVVKDWRQLVRIANIDTGNLAKTGDLLLISMIEASHLVEDLNVGRPVWYVNRRIGTYLHLQSRDITKQSTLSSENIGGRQVTTFLGIPVRETDALLSTEAPIT